MEGKPLARSMSYFEPQNALTYNLSDQYYWGDNILVAPVLQSGLNSRSVYLPAGEWYDYFNKTWVDGGQTINRNVSLNDIPLYMRGGSIIPMQNPRMSTDFMSTDTLNFVYYYSEKLSSFEGLVNGKTRVYEDNGYDTKPQMGLIDVYSAGNASVAKKIDIQITTDSANLYFTKPLKFIGFKVQRINKNYRNVVLIKPNGSLLCHLKRVFSMNDYLSTDSSFYYDGNANLLLHFNWYPKIALTISINDDSTSSTSNLNKVPDFAIEKVYPNPAKEKLNIDLQIIENANYKMELFNMKGLMVCDAEYLLSKGFQSHEFILPNGLNKGIYLFKITSDNTVFVKKVIIE
jgi:oligosaccharide 4-alpha-D-glucosyltransferase